jgi:hypothetical protein
MNLSSGLVNFSYPPADSFPISPPRPWTPSSVGRPRSHSISGDEAASDRSSIHSRHRSRSPSPSIVSRYNPPTAPRTRARRVTMGGSDSNSDDDDFVLPATVATRESRRDVIRRQRMESEQRMRDNLREAYARLKDSLPATNQKSSKVSLLDRGKSLHVIASWYPCSSVLLQPLFTSRNFRRRFNNSGQSPKMGMGHLRSELGMGSG